MTSILRKRKLEHREKQRRHTEGKSSCEDRGRNWSDVATSQGTQGLPASTRRQKTRKNSSLEPSKGAWPSQYFDFGLLASRIMRSQISAVLSHQACGNLLW